MTKLKVVSTDTPPLHEVPMQEPSLDIWRDKYRLVDGDGNAVDADIEATFDRVATALANVEPENREHWLEKFRWALRLGATPAGRIMSNAGALDYKANTSTINCTVSGPITDSMEGILQANLEAGLTLKAGCGIGYEFSTLRPAGAAVSGAGAQTSGPLSFMEIFDRTCMTVSSAGGRRGAQMGTFDVSHPDVFEFIRAKRQDGMLRQFNLSLLITDEFMEAVKADAPWPLVFPIKAKTLAEAESKAGEHPIHWKLFPTQDGYVVNDRGEVACRVYRIVRARELWDEVMSLTYDYAEPGFILIDRYNQMNNNWYCENIRATNPCVTADTWVHTGTGPRQVADLIGRPFHARVDGVDHATGPEGFFRTATRDVVKLTLQDGRSLRLTSGHRLRKITRLTRFQRETAWEQAGRLEPGDQVLLNDHRSNPAWSGRGTEDEGYLLGLLLGDGTLNRSKGVAVLSAWRPRTVAGSDVTGVDAVMTRALEAAARLPHHANYRGWSSVGRNNEYRLESAALKRIAGGLGITPGNKRVTAAVEKTSSDFHIGFLRGLFDADGSVQGQQNKGVSVRLAQSSLPCLEAVQRMLLRLGINSTVYAGRRPAQERELPDGRGGLRAYRCRAQHELVIAGSNLAMFAETIGFVDADKQARLTNRLGNYRRALNAERFIGVVSAVVADGCEDVYDVQVPGINTFDANGLHAHNCGEQGLPYYGSCLLGSINLTRFVRQPFTDKAEFDWATYREVVRVFTRMMDNVVEINGLPLAEQRREITAKRRHGIGYLGLGSAVTLMGMRYGSPEAVAFTEQVTRELAVEGWRVGLELAKEKGMAPILAEEHEVTAEMLAARPRMAADGYAVGDTVPGRVLLGRYSNYMRQIATVDAALVEAIAEHGARFTHHSSIAPTGTIALSFGNNASNGIEPSFAHSYMRNIIRPGKKTKEQVEVQSYELLAYRSLVNPRAMPYTDVAEEKLPDYFITTDDIRPEEHVDMQAAAQTWIDSSISKTVNVPTDIPYEDFKDLYLYAYSKGLKGCTTFRFNPEAFQGVLVKQDDLSNTKYKFTLDDGSVVEVAGNEKIEYDGEEHTAANLFDALKEGQYGRF
jgi:ribonucleoside-diphosphate reductase alpha chain